MKLKLIAAAVAALGSAAAGATVLNPATDSATNVYYIAGASAQAQAFNAIAKSLFDVPNDVVKILAANSGTCAGRDNNDENKHVAYFGVRGGVNTLLIYRNKDGSGSGVQQLLANSTAATAVGGGNGIVITLPGSAPSGSAPNITATSSNCVARLPVGALSDEKHTELDASVLAVAGTTNYDALSAIKTPIKTGLQGFGVAVSGSLYTALQTANTTAGIPLGTGGQPSIRKADYASLADINGTIKTAADLLNDSSITNTIEIARRVNLSGTQAASNLYFLAAKTGGAQTPATAADFPIADIATNGIGVTENSSTGNVKTRLNGSGYVIGIVSLENVPCTGAGTPDASCTAAESWKFVAIDRVSPNYAYDLATSTVVVDPYQRQQMADGSYDFAYESYLLYKDASLNTGSGIIKAIGDNIKLTSKSNLRGYAYIDAPGTWAAWDSSLGYTGNTNKQSRVSRGGNNLAPLKY
jgi:hypothetical protein